MFSSDHELQFCNRETFPSLAIYKCAISKIYYLPVYESIENIAMMKNINVLGNVVYFVMLHDFDQNIACMPFSCVAGVLKKFCDTVMVPHRSKYVVPHGIRQILTRVCIHSYHRYHAYSNSYCLNKLIATF